GLQVSDLSGRPMRRQTLRLLASQRKARSHRLPALIHSVSPPPDQAQCGCGLVFAQDPQLIGEEKRLIGEVATPLQTSKQTLGQFVLVGQCDLLERLCLPGEEATPVGKVFGSSGKSYFGRQLVAGVNRAPGGVVRRRSLLQALDHIITLQGQRELRRTPPGRITVQNV